MGQLHGAVSKSMIRTSRYMSQKIRSLEDVVIPDPDTPHPIPPFRQPRLNEIFCLMDVDFMRPQGARPWAPPYSLRVMNPDPDYFNEEFVQVGPSPTEFDVCGSALQQAHQDDKPTWVDEAGLGEALQADGAVSNSLAGWTGSDWGFHPQSPGDVPCPEDDSLTLCEEIDDDSEDAALLAGVIRAGLVTQHARNRL